MLSKTIPVPVSQKSSYFQQLMRLGLFILPCLLLAGAAWRAPDEQADFLWFGAMLQLTACVFALAAGPGWRGPAALAVIVLYVTGLGWLMAAGFKPTDWYVHVARAVLLMTPLCFFGVQCLRESGASALRQARQLASRFARRTKWPTELADCALLPEVADFREALHIDASPALSLLSDTRPQVRLAALAALEYRQRWRPGQPDVVLQMARNAAEPEIRVAAVRALANLADRELVERLAEFLYDPSGRVRRAAGEALLGDSDVNWAWIRPAVRVALAEPLCQKDGPLCPQEGQLTPEAVIDLTAWTAEKGLLGLRAALTLGEHYTRMLATNPDVDLLNLLRRKVGDDRVPPMLRLELARLLHQHKELDSALLRQLVTPSIPAPLRLLAVEALLASGGTAQAIAALHDLARLPNREIALAVAEAVQRQLGIDMGLQPDQPMPPIQSRQAAEVARRVMTWVSQADGRVEPPSEVGSGVMEHV